MLSKLICSVFGHRYTVDRVLNDGARKVGCARCGKSWAMHDATCSLIPWDSELEALYAPEGDLARPLRGASSMAAEGELARMSDDHPAPAVDFRTEATRQIAEHMAMKVDAVLRDAVTRFLGRSDWTMEELQGRACCRHIAGVDVFCVDGMPLVELPAVRTETASKTGILRATQDFRLRV